MENIKVLSTGKLIWQGKEYKCALGKSGVVAAEKKAEGDKATPEGCFPLREVFYRQDKIKKPETELPVKIINLDDGWCDESKDKNYNKLVKMPYLASAENLWREDFLYDIVVPIGYNDNPPVAGKGSAIFIHIARENYSPTFGCIALALPDLLEILKTVKKETLVCIKPT